MNNQINKLTSAKRETMKRIFVLMAVVAIFVTRASAQVATGVLSPADGFNAALSATESQMMTLVQAMPAEKYEFAPSQAIFVPYQKTTYNGVRTFEGLILHVAQANYIMATRFSGLKPDVDMKSFAGLKTKDEIDAALADSFVFVHKAIGTRNQRIATTSGADMKLKRIITADGTSGVANKIDTIDTEKVDFLTNIWGFDRVPELPLTPDQVLGEYKPLGMFGPLGGLRVDLFTLAPESAEGTSALQRAASVDIGTPGMVPGKESDGMHRTDSIDLAIVLEGEVNAGYPGEDGQVHELTLKTGDVMVNNGTFRS